MKITIEVTQSELSKLSTSDTKVQNLVWALLSKSDPEKYKLECGITSFNNSELVDNGVELDVNVSVEVI